MSMLNIYCKEIAHFKRLSAEDELLMIERISQGDIVARQVLIQSYLRLVVSMARYPKFCRQAEVMDLIQEGNIGLIRAVDCFDASLGYPFVGFARECIRNRMLLFLQKKYDELLTLDSPVFEDSEEYVCRGDLVVDESNVLGDASFANVEDEMVRAERMRSVQTALESLPRREREVVQLVYGIGVRSAMSLQEVAMLIGVSKERVGQTRDEALRRLASVL